MKRVRRVLSRIRHIRGHGVHSPYIYTLVREVFMRRKLLCTTDSIALYDLLQRVGELGERRCVELQNVATHCGYSHFTIDSEELQGTDMVVVTSLHPVALLEGIVATAAACGTTVAILHPEGSTERERVCERITTEHKSTTVRRREYVLIFNNHLPKQHFEL
ncbi:MAG: hypothetical protein R3Y68_02905 [Rikenellaceae bacterium]